MKVHLTSSLFTVLATVVVVLANEECGAPWNLQSPPHLQDYLINFARRPSPLQNSTQADFFVGETDAVLKSILVDASDTNQQSQTAFLQAGPRKDIFFDPSMVKAAIVTCGGICPGLNTVVRELVYTLWTQYNVRDIWGVHGGFRGFYAGEWEKLIPDTVNQIHTLGGSVLSSSRGGFDEEKIIQALVNHGINMVFVVGGDGTMRGAEVISEGVKRRRLPIGVCGIPKTIDNDIPIIDHSFGFETSVEEAQRAISAAHVEATSFPNAVGIVQLMGRHSGFIALHASLASRDPDCVLIPEIDFKLDGKDGLFEFMERRLKENGHLVLVVAEGSGQQEVRRQLGEGNAQDLSGNSVLANVGTWLKSKIKDHFDHDGDESLRPVSIKYIDPTYMVRATRSNAADNVYCTQLARGAVHGLFAGYSGFMVGPINTHHAMIPISMLTNKTNVVSVHGALWADVLATTRQPNFPPVFPTCIPETETTFGGCTVNRE